MTNPFTVLIDLDSTVYDLMTPWIEWYNTRYHDTLRIQDIDRWSWHELCKPECGLHLYSFLNKKGLFESLKMYPHAASAIQKIHSWGIKQVFCSTIVGITGCHEKLNVIERDFPYLGKESLVLVGGDKTLLQGDILVDDGPHNIEAFKKSGRSTILANLSGSGWCSKSDYADTTLTDWRDYPLVISDFVRRSVEEVG